MRTKRCNFPFFGGLLLFALSLLIACNEESTSEVDLMPAIRVRVLNGCGYRNAASDYSNHLIQYNIDVIDVGNTGKFIYNRSIIVIKQEDKQDLARLMKYTGITRKIYALDNQAIESFQIIVGRDFRDLMK